MRSSVIAAAFVLAACSAETPAPKTDATGASPADAAAPEGTSAADTASLRVMDVGPKAAALAYAVSQHSPLLTDAQRMAISQDFNGAPLGTEPQVHTVTAESLSCLARTENVGEGTLCSIDYGAESKGLAGEEAKYLFDALGSAGVESAGVQSVSSVSRVERAITKLSCTVDDAIAQGTSSSGSEINGFACRFTVKL